MTPEEADVFFREFELKHRKPYSDEILAAWCKKKMSLFNYDFGVWCKTIQEYRKLIDGQQDDFEKYLASLSFKEISEFRELLKKEYEKSLEKGLECFKKTKPSEPEESFPRVFRVLMEEITGDSYHADLLIGMHNLKSMFDASNLTVMDYIHAEILNLQQCQELMVLVNILSRHGLEFLLRLVMRPFDGPVLAMLGFKHDKECTLNVLPREIALKITHMAAGTNPVGKFVKP